MNSNIRFAKIDDAQALRDLLDQLGYPKTEEYIKERLQKLLNSDTDEVLVYDEAGSVLGFVSLHYTVQLAFDGEFCELTYFVVNENSRSKQIGKQLEERAVEVAREHGCELISVFSMGHRVDAHRFYERQGYVHTLKYFEKKI